MIGTNGEIFPGKEWSLSLILVCEGHAASTRRWPRCCRYPRRSTIALWIFFGGVSVCWIFARIAKRVKLPSDVSARLNGVQFVLSRLPVRNSDQSFEVKAVFWKHRQANSDGKPDMRAGPDRDL